MLQRRVRDASYNEYKGVLQQGFFTIFSYYTCSIRVLHLRHRYYFDFCAKHYTGLFPAGRM